MKNHDTQNKTAHKVKRGIYLLPSLFTLGNIGAGVFSIVSSINENYPKAAWAILLALAFDILDGRIARITRSVSRFGVEFDSLADLLSFGVAPAILMYQLILHNFGKLGGVIAFLFIIAGAIRLARFNVKAEQGVVDFFEGLPIPAAAGILASFVIIYNMFIQEITARTIPLIIKNVPLMYKGIPLVMIILSYLMVSNIHYTSFKKIKLGKRKSMRLFISTIVFLVVVWLYPENMILIIFLVYILSGVFDLFWRIYRLRRRQQ